MTCLIVTVRLKDQQSKKHQVAGLGVLLYIIILKWLALISLNFSTSCPTLEDCGCNGFADVLWDPSQYVPGSRLGVCCLSSF